MSTNEQPDAARIEANAAAIAVNPVYENERLAELTHWGAPWANLRVVVVGMGTSGDAVTDVLAQLGAHIVAIDGADTPEKRERIEIYKNAYGNVEGLFGPEHMRALPWWMVRTRACGDLPGRASRPPGHAGRLRASASRFGAMWSWRGA